MFRSSVTKIVTILGTALVGCLAAHAHTRPLYGGTLRVETLADPWQPADSLGRRLVFDGLTRTGPDGALEPALALRWKSQNQDHRWQFWLRPDVRFHDGSPVTPEAVARSLARTCADRCPWTAVRTLSDSVIFTTASPDPVLPAELARTAYLVSSPDAPDGTTGTGPFRFISNVNNTLTLSAFDDAWQGRPFLDSIEIAGRRALRNQLLDLSASRADVIDLPIDSLRQAQQDHLALLTSAPCDLLAITLALPDESQRTAISLAIDRATLANVIFQKQAEPTASLLPNSLTGYSFLFPTARDLPRAQQLRGATSDKPLTLSVEDASPAIQLAAERIALNLRDAGFRIQIVPPGIAAPDLLLRRIHLESADPQAALQQLLQLFSQQLSDESPDPAVLYREESTFLQAHTVLPLLYLPRVFAVGPRVRGLRLSAEGIPLLADASLESAR